MKEDKQPAEVAQAPAKINKMGNAAERAAYWQQVRLAYISRADKPTLRVLAKEFACSVPRAGAHCKKENWLGLREQHWARVEQQVDKINKEQDKHAIETQADTAAKRLRDNLAIVGAAKKSYVAYLVGYVEHTCVQCGKKQEVPVPKLEPSFRDIAEVMKLELLLEGKPDSRIGIEAQAYENFTPEERKAKMLLAIKVMIAQNVLTLDEIKQ